MPLSYDELLNLPLPRQLEHPYAYKARTTWRSSFMVITSPYAVLAASMTYCWLTVTNVARSFVTWQVGAGKHGPPSKDRSSVEKTEALALRLLFYTFLPVIVCWILPGNLLTVLLLHAIGLRVVGFRMLSEAAERFGHYFSCPNEGMDLYPGGRWLGSLAPGILDASNDQAMQSVQEDISAAAWDGDPTQFDGPLAKMMVRVAALAYEPHGDETKARYTELDDIPGVNYEQLNEQLSNGRLLDAKMYKWGFLSDDADVRMELSYGNPADQDTFVIILYSTKHNFIAVSFQGTSPFSLSMVLADAAVTLSELALPAGMTTSSHTSTSKPKVHQGFAHSLYDAPYTDGTPVLGIDIFAVIKSDIQRVYDQNFVASNQVPSLWIAGHSLGGAIATVFQYRVMNEMISETPLLRWGETMRFRSIGGYTIGSPRVGDEAFSKCFRYLAQQRNSQMWRIVNSNDIVARVPPSGLYQHVGKRLTVHYSPENHEPHWLHMYPRDFFAWATGAFTRFVSAVGVVLKMLLTGKVGDAVYYIIWFALSETVGIFLVKDHLPPGYFAHLEAYLQKKNKTQ